MKRWLRRLAVVAAIVVVLLLAALLAFRWWGQARLKSATTAFEQEIGSLDPSRFLLPALPDEENAAVWLLAGAQAIVITSDAKAAWIEGLSVPLDSWTPELRETVGELVESNEPGIELLMRALPLEMSNFGIRYDEGLDAEIPPVIELLRAGKLIRLDTRLAVRGGQIERLGRDIAVLDNLARSLGRESQLITALITLSLDRLLVETAQEVVQSGLAEPALLRDLHFRLQDRDRVELLRRAFASEASLVATTSADQLLPENASVVSKASSWFVEPPYIALMLEGHAELAAILNAPFVTIREYYNSEQGLPAWKVFGFLLPNLLDAIGKVKAYETSRWLALESLKLRLKCLEQGGYPSRLEAGSAKLDLAVPDLREPYAGGTLVIEMTEDGQPILSAPEAIDLWGREYPEPQTVKAPPLVWKLPACDPQSF